MRTTPGATARTRRSNLGVAVGSPSENPPHHAGERVLTARAVRRPKALEYYRGTPSHAPLANAFEKDSAGFTTQGSFTPAGNLASGSCHPFGPSKADLRILERISRAALKSSEIAFPTLKLQGTTADARRMQPDHLAIQTNPTYRIRYYAQREALRTFPVIRIHNINISDR